MGRDFLSRFTGKYYNMNCLKEDCFVKDRWRCPFIITILKMEVGFKADLMVEKRVIVELKSVEIVVPVHKKKLLCYLRLANPPIGLLINFNEALLKNGITRMFNNKVS